MRPVGNWSLIGCIIVSLSMKMSVFCGRAVMLEVGGQKNSFFLASKGEMDTLSKNRGIFLAGMSLSGEPRPLPLVGSGPRR